MCPGEKDLSISIQKRCNCITALLRKLPPRSPRMLLRLNRVAGINAYASRNPEQADKELQAFLEDLRLEVDEKGEKLVPPELFEEYLSCIKPSSLTEDAP